MPGDNQKTGQQSEIKGATTTTTHGLDPTADLYLPTPGGGYITVTDNTAPIEEIVRRFQQETGATGFNWYMAPATEADAQEFKKKAVEKRMVANLGSVLGIGKKEGPPEDQSLEPKANANTKNE